MPETAVIETAKAPRRKRGPRVQAQPGAVLLPARQAEAEFGIHYTKLRTLHFQGHLAAVRLGTAWYFKRADIEAVIERNTVQVG